LSIDAVKESSDDKDNPTDSANAHKKLDDIKTVSFVEEKKATTSPDESTSIKVTKLSE